MRLPVTLVASDLDNTLLSGVAQPHTCDVSPYTCAVMQRVQQAGIPVAFATSRSLRNIFVQGLRADYIVACNGALVYKGDALLHADYIPKATVDDVVDALRGCSAVHTIGLECPDRFLTNTEGGVWAQEWQPTYTDYRRLPHLPAAKISIECNDAAFIRTLTDRHADDVRLVEYSDMDAWFTLAPVQADKGTGVAVVARDVGTALQQTACFGDDENDLAMIRACGYSVAVENAIASVRRAARYECPANTADGPAHWLEQHVLCYH